MSQQCCQTSLIFAILAELSLCFRIQCHVVKIALNSFVYPIIVVISVSSVLGVLQAMRIFARLLANLDFYPLAILSLLKITKVDHGRAVLIRPRRPLHGPALPAAGLLSGRRLPVP